MELENEWFVPSSLLSDMRRTLCEELIKEHRKNYGREDMRLNECDVPFPVSSLDYRGNVSNNYAAAFYKAHGVENLSLAFEKAPVAGVPVMFCKHCIKFSMGWCTRSGVKHHYKEPFFLVSGDGKRFRLAFDCKECQMQVLAE